MNSFWKLCFRTPNQFCCSRAPTMITSSRSNRNSAAYSSSTFYTMRIVVDWLKMLYGELESAMVCAFFSFRMNASEHKRETHNESEQMQSNHEFVRNFIWFNFRVYEMNSTFFLQADRKFRNGCIRFECVREILEKRENEKCSTHLHLLGVRMYARPETIDGL